MRIVTKKPIVRFQRTHPDSRSALEGWFSIVKSAAWQSLQDVRVVFPQADGVRVSSGRTVVIFNIDGNKDRLVAAIHYNRQIVYVLAIMTHGEYDKERWKERL